MKKALFLPLFSILLVLNVFSQDYTRNYNFDLTSVENNLPIGWEIMGNKGYTVTIDSTERLNGKPTIRISSDSDTAKYWAGLQFRIPDNFRGKSLQLIASIKTKAVKIDGHAGILADVKPDIDFQNLEHESINGDRDWREEFIQVNLKPKETETASIGLYLTGTGTVWFGNLRLFVDWKPYESVPLYEDGADSIYRSNSHVPHFDLTPKNQQILKDVAQIWGLIKYFHPSVAEGKWDMDTELFKFLPKILVQNSDQDTEHELINWIQHFGTFSTSSDSNPFTINADSTKQEADFTWIDRLNYSSDLKDLLHTLTKLNQANNHYYIDHIDGPNHPSFYEYSYLNASQDDIGIRLMGLFRYWNIVNYFFPYRYLTDDSWDKILNEFIPVFHESKTTPAIDSAYLRLIAKSDDSHSFNQLSDPYNTPVFGRKDIGFKTKIINEKAVITSLNDDLSRKNILFVGDIIYEIDGVLVKDIIQTKRPFVAASNRGTALRDIAKLLFRTDKEVLKIKLFRNNESHEVIVRTLDIPSIQTTANSDTIPFRIIHHRIGYIQAGKFGDNNLPAFLKEMENITAIIIDYRQYPISDLHRLFSDHLFPKEKVFVRMSHNKGFSPGKMVVKTSSTIGKYNPDHFKGKVVILIDSETQSAAEFQTMAFQTIPEVSVIGSNSAGADGNISSIPLPYGYKTWFSGIGVYYPDLSETQRIGITPDVFVEQTAEGIKDGRDELLEAAIKYINESKEVAKGNK